MPTKDELVQRYNRMNTIPQVRGVGTEKEICSEKERDKFNISVRTLRRQRLKWKILHLLLKYWLTSADQYLVLSVPTRNYSGKQF